MWVARGRRLCVFALVGILAGSVATPHAPAARAHPSRILVIDGGGFGHGRGMGQWGARGMAEDGVGWRRILAHYYRGARASHVRSVSVIRVRLQIARTIRTWSARPYVVTVGSRRYRIGDERFLRVRRDGAATVVQRAREASGPWRTLTRTTRRVTIGSERAALWLFRPGGGLRGYQGMLVIRSHREQLSVTNHVGLEPYVASVLPREMPASWPRDALRAQAVAARTYAVNVAERARAARMSYDICASTGCQVFGGIAWRPSLREPPTSSRHPRADDAASQTAKVILTYRGRPIFAQYSSSTGGFTDSGGAPYLRAIADPSDHVSPYHRWRTTIAASSIEHRFPRLGTVRRIRIVQRNGAGPWGGRVRRVLLDGTRSDIALSGDRFQAVFGLRSDLFTLRWQRYRFVRDMGEGARGHAVRHLQQRLLEEGAFPRDAPRTTYFGPITRDSLKRYQRAHRIRATGYLGPMTRRSLNRRA